MSGLDDERPGRPVVLGLTGNIACGKSTVSRMLAALGAEPIDADAVYHELIAPGQPLARRLHERFGDRIADPDGGIDRRALAAIVFSKPAALAALDALTHPAVVAEVRARIARSGAGVVVVDAVKLIESGLDADCDQVWLVTCPPEQQIARLMARSGLSEDEARRRVEAQPPLGPKLDRADVVIDNGGSLAATAEQVERAWAASSRRSSHANRRRLHGDPELSPQAHELPGSQSPADRTTTHQD